MAPLPVCSEWWYRSSPLLICTRPFAFACFFLRAPFVLAVRVLTRLRHQPLLSRSARSFIRHRFPLYRRSPCCTFSATTLLTAYFCVHLSSCFFAPSSDSFHRAILRRLLYVAFFVLAVAFFALVLAPLDPSPPLNAFARASTPPGNNADSYSESELEFSSSDNFTWLSRLRVFALPAPGTYSILSAFSGGQWLPVSSGVFLSLLRSRISAFQLSRSF